MKLTSGPSTRWTPLNLHPGIFSSKTLHFFLTEERKTWASWMMWGRVNYQEILILNWTNPLTLTCSYWKFNHLDPQSTSHNNGTSVCDFNRTSYLLAVLPDFLEGRQKPLVLFLWKVKSGQWRQEPKIHKGGQHGQGIQLQSPVISK